MFNDITWMDFGYVLIFGYCAVALRMADNLRRRVDNSNYKLRPADILIELIISSGMSVGVLGAYMYLHFQKNSLLLFAFGSTLAYEPILNLFRAYFVARATQVLASDRDSSVRDDTPRQQ